MAGLHAGGLVKREPLPQTDRMTEHHGACHCGAIELTYRSDIAPADAELRACQCRFCRKRAALAVSDPQGHLEVRTKDPALLQRYTFGLGTAEYLLCRNCGVYLAALMTEDEAAYGIAIVHALDEAERFTGTPIKADYDAEDETARRTRRRDRWTPAVLTIADA